MLFASDDEGEQCNPASAVVTAEKLAFLTSPCACGHRVCFQQFATEPKTAALISKRQEFRNLRPHDKARLDQTTISAACFNVQ